MWKDIIYTYIYTKTFLCCIFISRKIYIRQFLNRFPFYFFLIIGIPTKKLHDKDDKKRKIQRENTKKQICFTELKDKRSHHVYTYIYVMSKNLLCFKEKIYMYVEGDWSENRFSRTTC